MLLNILKRSIFLPALFTLSSSIPTMACVCGGTPSLLDSYKRSDALVIAKLKSIKKPFWAELTRGYYFEVSKIYKEHSSLPKRLYIPANYSSCDPYYEKEDIDQEFLLYLNKNEELSPYWHAFRCGRSVPVSYAYTDLLYLNNMASLTGKTRIVGSVTLNNETPTEYKPPTALAGYKIKLTGADNVYNLVTDSQGVFEIYDIPPGAYFIACETPENMKIEKNVAVADMQHPPNSMKQIGEDYLKVMNKFPDIIKNGTPYYYVAPSSHVEVQITLQKK